ncbi:MAG: arylsulfatase [Thermoguttaceae bacterium]|jgi:arylsulfatase|nr:arylsulfatase [Thermoguttaceae bacterium]
MAPPVPKAAGPFLAVPVCIVLIAMSARTSEAQPGPRDQPPNIVIVLADDLGYSDVSCFGGEISTPHIDRLAKEGLRFTQFYNCGQDSPTRAALLTGFYPHQVGMGHSTADYRQPGYRGNLSREHATLAELLGQGGYQTMMVGKWHLTPHVAPEGPKHTWPVNRGFERFYGTIHGAGSYFAPVTLCRGGQFLDETDPDFYYTDRIAHHAGTFIEQAARGNKPFFLYVAFAAPHWPLHAPSLAIERQRARYASGWDEVRKNRFERMQALGILKRQWKPTPIDERVGPWELNQLRDWQQRRMEVYAAQVDLMDRAVGRILESLRQTGAEQNTLVLFLSDNGASAEEIMPNWRGAGIPKETRAGRAVQVGNHPDILPGAEDTYQSYGIAWANVSNTPFRLYKGDVHEGGIATPLIVHWPAVLRQGGQMTGQVGHVIDIVPTCLEIARIRYPAMYQGRNLAPLEGRSLAPILQGQTRSEGKLFWEHAGNRAVRDGKWKLVARHRGPWELYDMEADRTETANLAGQHPAVVRDLSESYAAWAKRCNVLPWHD